MKLIPFSWKRLVPILFLILFPTFSFSDLPPSSDLILSDVEIVQVVLGPKGVIAGKPAVLRLTIESTFPIRKYITVRVNYNDGDTFLDTGSGSGVPIDPGTNTVYIPGGPALPASPIPWGKEGEGPYLIWDLEASGDIVNVMIDPENAVPEINEENNRKLFYVDVFHIPRLKVLIAPIALPDQEDWEPDRGIIERHRRFMENTYPISNLKFTRRGLWRTEAIPPDDPDVTYWLNKDWFYNHVVLPLSTEADILGFDRLAVVHVNNKRYWNLSFCGSAMGMLREPQNRLPIVIITQKDQFGSEACLDEEKLIAHEIGHTYFLWHPFSDLFLLPVYDSEKYSVTELIYGDWTNTFMDYAPSPWWIDDERYQSFPKTWVDTSSAYPIAGTYMWNLFDQFTELPTRMSVLAVRGTIFKDKAMLAYGYRFQGRPHINPQGQEPPPTPPYYQIVLLGSQKEILAEYPFKASFKYALENDFDKEIEIIETDAVPFHINVPYVEGTAFIQLKNPDGTVLRSMAVSPNSPEVAILSPNGGEVLGIGSKVGVCWQGQDQDGDGLTYLLAYSDNGGSDWIPIGSDLKETCHTWTTKGLPPGNEYMVKVIATDGVNTAEDISNATFSLLTPIKAEVDIKPETINLKSKRVFTAFLSLPQPYRVEEVDLGTVVCEGAPAVKGTVSDGGLTVKFDREDLRITTAGSAAVFKVTGKMKNGTPFEGSDLVKLIRK